METLIKDKRYHDLLQFVRHIFPKIAIIDHSFPLNLA